MSDTPSKPADIPCRVCSAAAQPFFRKLILDRHDVGYFKCPACGHVQTEKPYWLEEAYRDKIGKIDVGMADRCIWTAQTTVALALKLGIKPDEPCLDWGGGTGLFVRLCRDLGLNFLYHDRYAENIFASGFDRRDVPSPPAWTLVTSFEVAEHLPDPMADFAELFRLGPRYILFSTLLYLGQAPDWWYFTDNGQHVAFYTRRSLEFIARHFGYHLATNDCDLHLFSRERIADRLLDACRKSRERKAARYRKKHGSKNSADFQHMLQYVRESRLKAAANPPETPHP